MNSSAAVAMWKARISPRSTNILLLQVCWKQKHKGDNLSFRILPLSTVCMVQYDGKYKPVQFTGTFLWKEQTLNLEPNAYGKTIKFRYFSCNTACLTILKSGQSVIPSTPAWKKKTRPLVRWSSKDLKQSSLWFSILTLVNQSIFIHSWLRQIKSSLPPSGM